MRRILKLPLAAVIALTCLFGTVGAAHADSNPLGTTQILETADSRTACTDPVIVNPFTQFGDNLDYVLAPDGNFDGSVAGWQFAGGANVVATDKGSSLQLPKGASAISSVDVPGPELSDLPHVPQGGQAQDGPARRLLNLVLGDADDAEIRVEVVYHEIANPVGGDGGVRRQAGRVRRQRLDAQRPHRPEARPGWSAPGARQAALRFTVVDAESKESVLLDDVYVDPMRR